MSEAVITGGMGLMSTFINNLMAKGRETANRRQEYNYNEMAANNAEQRLRERYEMYQSPESMLKQYQDAGLSPSLMYESGAAGTMGSSAAQGGVGSMPPQIFPFDPMMLAEIQLKQAQARNLNVDADTKEGNNERGAAEINKLIMEGNNQQLKNDWQAYENMIKSWDTAIKNETADYEIKSAAARYEMLLDEARSAKVKGNIDERTENDIVKMVNEQVRNLTADTILKKCQQQKVFADIQMNSAQMAKMIADIQLAQGTLALDKEKLQSQIEQWGKENGFTDKELNIKMASVVANVILTLRGQNQQAFGKLLDTFSPFAKGGTDIPTPTAGVPPLPMN